MMVRCFIDHGHKAYLLVGGATGMVGDPDGKSSERSLKTLDEVEKNKAGIASQYNQIFSGKNFTIVDNYDWFKDFNYLDFLRTVGKFVPVNQMLGRDFIQKRINSEGGGISYAEFSYSLIQGYDFVHLYKNYGVTLQVCGGDQWGNSIAGVDLIRRIEGGEAHVYSIPLVINKSTNTKFGKSEGGAVWLNPEKTSVYKFYQFWLNVDDIGVIDYIKIYTLLSKEKIDEIEALTKDKPELRLAQKTLAHEVTTLVHGSQRAESVKRVTEVLFGDADFKTLNQVDIDQLSKEIPTIELGVSIFDALIRTKIAKSNGEVRRLIQGGAIHVNGSKVDDNIILDYVSLIKKGKNSFVLVK
jgi:tyrosyl-tRNA synthetase